METHRRSVVGRVVAVTALAASALTFAPQAATAARTYPLGVVARDYSFQGVPSRLPAGEYNLRFFNLGSEPHVLVAINLGSECSESITTAEEAIEFLGTVESVEDFVAACPGGRPAGDVFALPGGRSSGPLSLAPGRTLVFCPIPDAMFTPHHELGMIAFIDVIGLPGGFGF